jgi:hypothetical protein
MDGGRDIINFVDHVLPGVEEDEGVLGEALPWRENKGGSGRKIIGVGHSFGGTGLWVLGW